MFLLRLMAVLAFIVVLLGGLAFVLTQQRRYLDMTWRFCRYTLIVAVLLFALLALERVAAIVW